VEEGEETDPYLAVEQEDAEEGVPGEFNTRAQEDDLDDEDDFDDDDDDEE
jgi:hypothetical protein